MAIELIVLDVDGTLTNSRISYSENGDEIKSFNVKDGLGISSWIRLGRQAAIITGRRSGIVTRRAEELQIRHCYQGVSDKKERLESLLKELNLDWDQVAAIGDDLNDYAMLKAAAISFVPQDADVRLARVADVILKRPGGEGAVREMIEELIRREGLTRELHALWSVE